MYCLFEIEMSTRVEHLVVVNRDELNLKNLIQDAVEGARKRDVELLEHIESIFDQTVK